MDIRIVSMGEEADWNGRNLHFTWVVTSFTPRTMKIDLTFEDPISVSGFQDADTIEIEFLKNFH